MRIAIMQPYFFPYIGYFQLINAVETFIFYDDVNYIKGGWINRNRILVNTQENIFTLPLAGASSNKKIRDIEVDIKQYHKWRTKFMRTLQQSYARAPFFDEAEAVIAHGLKDTPGSIAEKANESVKAVMEYLGIESQVVDTSTVYNNDYLKAQDRVLDICRQENADHYINPIGGMELYDRSVFAEKGIKLNFIKSKFPPYRQFNDTFVQGLSIIDIMMFNSVDEIKDMLNSFELI